MSLAPLRDALCTLHQAFRRPDIIGWRDDLAVIVELSHEAGARFELWLRENAPVSMRCDPSWIQTTGGADSIRSLTLDGVKVQWRVAMMALPGSAEGRPRPSAV